MSTFLIRSLRSMCKFSPTDLDETRLTLVTALSAITHHKSRPTSHLPWCSHTNTAFLRHHFRTDPLSRRVLSHWVVYQTGVKVHSANGTSDHCTRPACSLSKWRSSRSGLRSAGSKFRVLYFLHVFLSLCIFRFVKRAFAGGGLVYNGVLSPRGAWWEHLACTSNA
jgi:hypothetical protein